MVFTVSRLKKYIFFKQHTTYCKLSTLEMVPWGLFRCWKSAEICRNFSQLFFKVSSILIFSMLLGVKKVLQNQCWIKTLKRWLCPLGRYKYVALTLVDYIYNLQTWINTHLFPLGAGKAEQNWLTMWLIVEYFSGPGSLWKNKTNN